MFRTINIHGVYLFVSLIIHVLISGKPFKFRKRGVLVDEIYVLLGCFLKVK